MHSLPGACLFSEFHMLNQQHDVAYTDTRILIFFVERSIYFVENIQLGELSRENKKGRLTSKYGVKVHALSTCTETSGATRLDAQLLCFYPPHSHHMFANAGW